MSRAVTIFQHRNTLFWSLEEDLNSTLPSLLSTIQRRRYFSKTNN